MAEPQPIRPEPMYPLDLDKAPKITLGGKPWAVPELAIGQAMHVVPALTAIMPVLGRMMTAVVTDESGKTSIDEKKIVAMIGMIDEATFASIADAVFWSLKRAKPGLGRGEFDQIPVKVTELFAALPVILKQVGFIEPAKEGAGGAAAAGEAEAAPESTGTS